MVDLLSKSPQVHFIGKISGGHYFDTQTLYLKYSFKAGDNWKLIGGNPDGDTFQSSSSYGKMVPLEHPFDLNYVSQSIRGWPKLFVEVWQIDETGRNSIAGYGVLSMPMQAGKYQIDIPCWRPKADFFDRLIGSFPELVHKDMLVSSDSRFGLKTETTGKIYLDLEVIVKDFFLHGVKIQKSGNEENEMMEDQ